MSKRPEDDWDKTRGRNDYLTAGEIATVKKCFEIKHPAELVARDLKCASRTIRKYYAQFRGECRPPRPKRIRPSRSGLDSKPAAAKPAKQLPSRFYKSNFEL